MEKGITSIVLKTYKNWNFNFSDENKIHFNSVKLVFNSIFTLTLTS